MMAIGILLFRKGAFKSLLYGIHSFRTGVRAPVFSGVFNKNYSIPYGVAIAGGAFLTLAFKGMISIW
jgi:prepilin peptidase CpaA